MQRQIVWPGAIPLETDLLNTNKYTMIALAKLASAIMGSSTYIRGLACTPTSPASMVVNVSAGEIYSLANIDGTAYSSLAADTTHSILKQGYVLDAQSFTLTAPSTSGYSINYLIQVTYADTDGGSTVLPYYNASNPSTAWSGPNNSGTSQYTVRQGLCTVSLKAGVAATTGTQTTPSPDTGYTGLYVITIAQGATTVTAANIAVYANAPFIPSTGLVDAIQRNALGFGTDTGTANAYIVNLNPGMLSVSVGTEVTFLAANANTSSSTLNVCGLGAASILNKFGATLIAGEIAANSLVTVEWNGSAWLKIEATGAIPTVPTATAGTSTTQTANTAFVTNAINTTTSLLNAGRLKNIVVITSTGTYTPSSGAGLLIVEGMAGGGGGGGAASSSSTASTGGGGGAGGYFLGVVSSVASSYSVTVGTAGSGGIPGTNGGTGGNTTFGSLFTANGGIGGQSYSAAQSGQQGASGGGYGGSAANGLINCRGASGGTGMWPNYTIGLPGQGAATKWGSPGIAVAISNSNYHSGDSATGFGAGGCGAASSNGAGSGTGGTGAPGLIVVYEYYWN